MTKRKPAAGAIQGRIGVDGTLLYCSECGEGVSILLEGMCRVCYDGGDAPLRDQFATAAMNAMLATKDEGFLQSFNGLARRAYEVADAMMKARRE